MKKIMLVEDDEAIGKALMTALQGNGYEVIWVQDGDTVIADLDSSVSLVYLDIRFPGLLDGFNILKMIKASDSQTKNIPVVMLTNESDPGLVSRAMEGGATDYLVKSNEKLEDIIGLTKKLIG